MLAALCEGGVGGGEGGEGSGGGSDGRRIFDAIETEIERHSEGARAGLRRSESRC